MDAYAWRSYVEVLLPPPKHVAWWASEGGLSGDSLGTPGRIEEAVTEPRLAKTLIPAVAESAESAESAGALRLCSSAWRVVVCRTALAR